MEESVSLEPQEAQPAPETTSRKDSKGYKIAKTAITFSLLGVIIVCLLISLLCYIKLPTRNVLGVVVYKNKNLFSFAYGKEGLINTLQELFKAFENGSSSISWMMNIINSLYRLLGLMAAALTVLIMSIVIIIKTIIHTVKKDTKSLTLDLIGVAKMNFVGVMLLKLFNYGTNNDIKVGGGLIASLVISLIVLLTIAVLNFVFFRKDIHKQNKYKQILRSFTTCLCQFIVFVVVASVAYYTCFSYLFSYFVVIDGHSLPVKEIISVYMNLAVFVLAIVLLARASKAIGHSLQYLCTLSDTEDKYAAKGSSGFIGAIVMTVLAMIAMIVARPYAGVGYIHLIVAVLFAICGEVCYILFNKTDFFKEEKPAAVPEAAPAEESVAPSAPEATTDTTDNTKNS